MNIRKHQNGTRQLWGGSRGKRLLYREHDYRNRLLCWLLCVCLLLADFPVLSVPAAAAGDGLCPHHIAHTAECGYIAPSDGSPCTHQHTESCYQAVRCAHIHDETCGESGEACAHVCTGESGCVTMAPDCRHIHDETCGYSETVQVLSPCQHVHDETCGYMEAVEEVLCDCAEQGENGEVTHEADCGYVAAVEPAPCQHVHDESCGYAETVTATPCTHVHSIEGGCYGLLCAHVEGQHDAACGYVPPSAGSPCTFVCEECNSGSEGSETGEPGENTENEETILCTCEAEDDCHATTCPLYTAPEEPICSCAEKCAAGAENIWCDVCGVTGAEHCLGDRVAAVYIAGGTCAVCGTGTYENGICSNESCTVRYQPCTGSGTSDDPYLIDCAGQLFWFAAVVNDNYGGTAKNAAAHGKLTADVNMSGCGTWKRMDAYSGTFDGDGHTIQNLNGGSEGEAFVRMLTGTVKQVTFDGAKVFHNVSGGSGIIACENQGTISRCVVVNSSIQYGAYDNFGILVGINRSTIEYSAAISSSATRRYGGAATKSMGGISEANRGTIRSCYTYNCAFNNGSARAAIVSDNAGGSVINCCYYTPTETVTAGNGTAITAAQFTSGEAAWLLNGSPTETSAMESGIWKQTIGSDTCPSLTGATVYRRLCCDAEVPGYANDTTSTIHASYDADGFCANCGAFQFCTGSGTSDAPYLIGNAGQLYWFAIVVNHGCEGTAQNTSACGKLTADIDLGERIWYPIGLYADPYDESGTLAPASSSARFNGTFDGDGHTVSRFKAISGDDSQGLFGTTGESSVIRNVGIVNAEIKGQCVGAVAGFLRGTLENCFVRDCTITGISNASYDRVYIGAVASTNIASDFGEVKNCYAANCTIVLTPQTNAEDAAIDQYWSYIGGQVSADGSAEIASRNSYYYNITLNCTATENVNERNGGTSAKSLAAFSSGEVAYLLNNSADAGLWKQTLGSGETAETYPGFSGESVYRWGTCQGDLYRNTAAPADLSAEHSYANGFCTNNTAGTVCGAYQPGSGSGTSEAPYLIGNAGQLYWFAAVVNSGYGETAKNTAACGKLTADVTINENVLNESGSLNGSGSGFRAWTPIREYAGTFDGDEHAIFGLYFNNTDRYDKTNSTYVGLFGTATTGAVIKNVSVKDSCLRGYDHVGGIAGEIDGSAIENCHNAGNIYSAQTCAGGIVGNMERNAADATLTKCSNTGIVYAATGNAGGMTGGVSFAGYLYYNYKFENCYNTGSVTSGKNGAGGIISYVQNPLIITNCYNSGTVRAEGTYAGGIVAAGSTSDVSVSNCYYLAGCATAASGGVISYGTGKTSDEFESGEIAWLLNGSSSAGVWKQNIDCAAVPDAVPNFTGASVYKVTGQCGNAEDTTVVYTNYNASTAHDYSDKGFCTRCGAYQPCFGGGTSGDPYRIGNAGQLYWFAIVVNNGYDSAAQNTGAHGKLTANIDLESRAWYPIGIYLDTYDASNEKKTAAFSGALDGDGHTVSNFHTAGQNSQALVGYCETNSVQIKNLGVINASASGWNAAAVLAYPRANTVVENCFARDCTTTGTFTYTADNPVSDGTYTTNTISVGTVVAVSSTGTVKNCYAADCTVQCGVVNANGVTNQKINLSTVGGGTNTKCYYTNVTLDSKGDGRCHEYKTKATEKTAAEFASGEVTWLLNGGTVGTSGSAATNGTQTWYQNLDNDSTPGSYPAFSGGTVYGYTDCVNTFDFSNTQYTDGIHRYTARPAFNWADDYSACTATFTCQAEASHDTVTMDCTVTSNIVGDMTSYFAIVYMNGTRYLDEKNVENTIVKAQVSWTAMEFVYSNGEWNPDTHAYGEGGWEPVASGGGVITMVNNGNVAINVLFQYVSASGLSEVGGSFTGNTTFALGVGNTASTTFEPTGKPGEKLDKAEIGTVRITISSAE